jgi:hypothetical protein
MLELTRLDRLLEVFFQKALGGDIASGLLCTKISQRRSCLLGLDPQAGFAVRVITEPAKHEMTTDKMRSAFDDVMGIGARERQLEDREMQGVAANGGRARRAHRPSRRAGRQASAEHRSRVDAAAQRPPVASQARRPAALIFRGRRKMFLTNQLRRPKAAPYPHHGRVNETAFGSHEKALKQSRLILVGW